MCSTLRSFALVTTLAVALVGCSSGYKAGTKTSDSIQGTASQIDGVAGRIDATVASLNKLTSAPAGADLRPLYKDYVSKVDALDEGAKDAKKRAEQMKAKGDAYFNEWDKQIAEMNNEEIRTQSAARRAEVKSSFQNIRTKSQTVADTYKPLMSDLQDIKTALNNDLTPGGISSIQPIADRVASQATKVKSAAADLAAEFKAVGVKMSPKGT